MGQAFFRCGALLLSAVQVQELVLKTITAPFSEKQSGYTQGEIITNHVVLSCVPSWLVNASLETLLFV